MAVSAALIPGPAGFAARMIRLSEAVPARPAAPSAGPTALYNAACSQSRDGDQDRAASMLLEAVRAGFADFSHLRRDPDLDSLRSHPTYQALLDARRVADPMLAARELERWRRQHPDAGYCYAADAQRQLLYVAATDHDGLTRLQRSVETQFDLLSASLFADAEHGYALIVLPTEADAGSLLPDDHTSGRFLRQSRRMIIRAPDQSLNHELVHVLHHRHMDALGQEHAAWIQEGLAALFEAYAIGPRGRLTFPPNGRDEAAMFLHARGRLLSLRELTSLPPREFERQAPRSYPQARSVLRFLAEQGRLMQWYLDYTRRFKDDPDGTAALERTLGQPLPQIERQWRAWVPAAAPAAAGAIGSWPRAHDDPMATIDDRYADDVPQATEHH